MKIEIVQGNNTRAHIMACTIFHALVLNKRKSTSRV